MTDTTLWLTRRPKENEMQDPDETVDETSPIFVAEILRSKLVRSKTWCTFKIENGLLVNHDVLTRR